MDVISPKEPDGSADKPADTVPKGAWGTILTTTPIVLTVLATAFAGLSSSEMTQAMYYRSLAAQHQSKAGDQWAFFQAKRIRGTNLEMTEELLQSLLHKLAGADCERERHAGHRQRLRHASRGRNCCHRADPVQHYRD